MTEILTLPKDAVTKKNEHIGNSYKMKFLDYSKSEKRYYISMDDHIKFMTKFKDRSLFCYNNL